MSAGLRKEVRRLKYKTLNSAERMVTVGGGGFETKMVARRTRPASITWSRVTTLLKDESELTGGGGSADADADADADAHDPGADPDPEAEAEVEVEVEVETGPSGF